MKQQEEPVSQTEAVPDSTVITIITILSVLTRIQTKDVDMNIIGTETVEMTDAVIGKCVHFSILASIFYTKARPGVPRTELK